MVLEELCRSRWKCKGPSGGLNSWPYTLFFSDNRGVMQALNKTEVDCISAGHNDTDLWVFGLGLNMRVVWTKAHATLEEKSRITLELAQIGAVQHGA